MRQPITRRPLTRHRARVTSRGLTVLELIVVIGVLVLILGVGIGGLDRLSSVQLRTQTNRLSAAIRHTYTRAVAHGLYMRLVLDLDADAYWVEASETAQFLSVEKRKEGEATAEEQAAEKEAEKRERDGAPPPPPRERYTEDGVIPRVNMERGIGISGVITLGQEDVFTSGKAYVHFFPNGFVEPAMIYTTDGKDSFYTLSIHPMTGRVKREIGKIDPPRHFGEPEKVEDERR